LGAERILRGLGERPFLKLGGGQTRNARFRKEGLTFLKGGIILIRIIKGLGWKG